MKGMSIEEGIEQVYGAGHVVILGAGASIASTIRNPELNGKILPSMDNFIKVVGLSDIVESLPKPFQVTNFEDLYSTLHQDNASSPEIIEIEHRVRQYFNDMQLPDEPTIYDYLVLSLRNKDVIASFNWDPFLYQAWVRNSHIGSNPGILFMHGTVSLGYDPEDGRAGPVGMYSKVTYQKFEPVKLLYPVSKKDYTNDEFIKGQWEALNYELNDKSNVKVTVFGYGAPASDVEAVSLLNEAWGTPEDRAMEQFEIIDIQDEQLLRAKWKGFIHSHHYDIVDDYFKSSLSKNPRRTIESHESHINPLSPHEAFRNNNPIPNTFQSLEKLWDWHKKLVEVEETVVTPTG